MALAPGERKRIAFALTPEQFAQYDADGRWSVESGEIRVMVGASSSDIRLRGAFEIATAYATSTPAAAIATQIDVTTLK